MPIPDALLASVAEASEEEASLIIARLSERVGRTILRGLLSDAAAAEQAEDLEVTSAADLIAEEDDGGDFLIEDLIPLNSVILITGKPKFGKSLLCYGIADSITSGEPCWASLPVKVTGPVLYIAMEDGKREVKKRVRRYFAVPRQGEKGGPAPYPMMPQLVYIVTVRVALKTEEGLDKLERAILKYGPALVIVDTAREGMGIKEWNDPVEVGDAFRPLRDLARQYCTIAVVHHNRKGDAEYAVDLIAGSGAVTSSVDGMIIVTSKEEEWALIEQADGTKKKRLVKRRLGIVTDGRGGMTGMHTVELDFSTLHARRIDDETLEQEEIGKRADARLERMRPVLEAIWAGGKNKTLAGDVGNATGDSYGHVSRLLKECVDGGYVEKSVKAQPALGIPAAFSVTQRAVNLLCLGGPYAGDATDEESPDDLFAAVTEAPKRIKEMLL